MGNLLHLDLKNLQIEHNQKKLFLIQLKILHIEKA